MKKEIKNNDEREKAQVHRRRKMLYTQWHAQSDYSVVAVRRTGTVSFMDVGSPSAQDAVHAVARTVRLFRRGRAQNWYSQFYGCGFTVGPKCCTRSGTHSPTIPWWARRTGTV
jgi:hypothetical protein